MRKSNDKLRILLKRSLVMFSVNIFLLFVLVGRLYYLQVYQGGKIRASGRQQPLFYPSSGSAARQHK